MRTKYHIPFQGGSYTFDPVHRKLLLEIDLENKIRVDRNGTRVVVSIMGESEPEMLQDKHGKFFPWKISLLVSREVRDEEDTPNDERAINIIRKLLSRVIPAADERMLIRLLEYMAYNDAPVEEYLKRHDRERDGWRGAVDGFFGEYRKKT